MSEAFWDMAPSDERWGHQEQICESGVKLHFVRQGEGKPVLLLHGWPGFWYDWRRVIPMLAQKADVIAPDFRGFGSSDRPDLPPTEGYTPQVLAEDIVFLIRQLNLEQVVLVAHDIGATVAQTLARIAPERIDSIVLLNPPYPGIGSRRFDPAVQGQFWYQHFHNLPWAEELVGRDRDTIDLYLRHFYEHWTGRKEALRPEEFEYIVDTYAKPGAFASSIAYYRARAGARAKEAGTDPQKIKITHPTTVLWGKADPVILASWSDRLDEYFSNVQLCLLEGVGHFVPFEAPEEVVTAISARL
ncbi:alpha/beta fold hydrolase [Aneurinibacillus sp. REN35]|uniref:alpha/beta fold hydrolase n=1 Tax=Aneurinibacillus sp. REN35 TaxID=3237286 RepID=UPI003527FE15